MAPMDRTAEFKKFVAAKSRGKSGTNHPILTKTKPKSDFEHKARKILLTISQLRKLLEENRKAYISSQNVFESIEAMSDLEKDQLETSAQEIIKNCSETIKKLENQVNKTSEKQVENHRVLVIEILRKYLSFVCKIYSEHRAIRVKQVVDKKVISRLHHPKLLSANSASTSAETLPQKSDFSLGEYEAEISDSEEAAFEQENAQMMKEYNSMVDEVKAIEGKVVEIARLQEVFAEQVLQQEADIEIVAEKVVESTENIKGGNEEVREAIKNNASFRVWILFFIVMCSFSLLFLEWYS